MKGLLVSPTALNYLPVFILHLASLGYLLLTKPRSRQKWLFCGWLAGMTVMTATQCAARMVYAPRASGYLDWWGGVGGVSLAMVALLQFAYHFPRLRYPQEARLALGISLLITGALFLWMLYEVYTAWPHSIYAMHPPRPAAAFAPEATWIIYDFTGFRGGLVSRRNAEGLTSFKLFDVWQMAGNTWILLVWLRKTIQFAAPAPEEAIPAGERLRRAWHALRHPQSRETRLARAWLLLMLLAPFPVLSSVLEGSHLLPPGTFAIVHLLVLFAIILTYVNYAAEPTTFMVKLVGISLVTLLIILGFVTNYATRSHQAAYTQMRQRELRYVRDLLAADNLAAMPDDVLYVAVRPIQGLFASQYHMRFEQATAPDAAALAAQDALLREGLLRGHFPTAIAVTHEHPWLGAEGVSALAGNAEMIDTLEIPERVTAYRGSAARTTEHILRYTFVQDGTRYEVGYRYPAYRYHLHQQILPLVALIAGASLAILIVFPRFFRIGLAAPLSRLLAGVDLVDHGDLNVSVPVTTEDEIGRLTHAFNRMVASLHTSEERLRALNLTLEQRVLDRTRDLATLYNVAALANQRQELDDLLAAALASVVPAVQGAAGVIFLRSDADSSFSLGAHYEVPPTLAVEMIGTYLCEKAFERNAPLLVHDLAHDDRLGARVPRDFPYATLVCVPLWGKEGWLGSLVVFGATPLLFNVEDLSLLGAVAEQLGIAVENTRLRKRAEAAIILEERQRLARDLHDSVTQLLYSQTLFAAAATKALRAQKLVGAEDYLERLGEAANRALREMRLMIYRLQPAELVEMGLTGALQRRLEIVEQRAGVRTTLHREALPALPTELEQALYYIAEEALNNALKHARATTVTVTLRQERGSVVLCVTDNGCGFDVAHVSAGMGLRSMRERAAELDGTLTITSELHAGTRIVARVPWKT